MVTLIGEGYDADNEDLVFQWIQISGDPVFLSSTSDVKFSDSSSGKTTVTTPNVVKDTEITLTCTVSDDTLNASDSLALTVKNILNQDIIADAGNDRIVNENIGISLDGTDSNDPENQSLTFAWTQISGEHVKLSSNSSMTPSFTSPSVSNNEIKVLVFELKVFDDNGIQAIDTVKITVDPINSPPEATASAKQS